MSGLLDLLLACNTYRVVVERTVPELAARLQDTLGSPPGSRQTGAAPYTGQVSESGFVARRNAAHGKDARASVTAQGRFLAEGEGTVVEVRVRHWWTMVFFTWLLVLLAISSAFAQPGGAALLAVAAALWQLRLYSNVRRVGRDIRALLVS
jgi:hypothetical protein